MSDAAPSREEVEPFPPDVATPEQRRRWELCCMSAYLVYGYNPDGQEPLDRWDLALLHRITRTYFESEFDTGPGVLSEAHRQLLRACGAL